MKTFGWAVFLLILIFPFIFLQGWAFATLWDWFIVPVFSAPFLSFVQGAGVCLFLNYAKFRHTDEDQTKDKLETVCKIIAVDLMTPLFFVGMGYVLKTIIGGG